MYKIILEEAAEGVCASKRRYDQGKRQTHSPRQILHPWGYQINPDHPLKFKASKAIKGLEPRLDISTIVLWMEEDKPPVQQNTHIRIWSCSNHIFRESMDAPNIKSELADPSRKYDGRVMWRCHFDLAKRGQPGPQYHLQFGGNARAYELCWLPKIIDLPRLVSPPMDLVLACQLVAANFFWENYLGFRESPEWIAVLRNTQEHLLKYYYEKCRRAVESNNSVLDILWNI